MQIFEKSEGIEYKAPHMDGISPVLAELLFRRGAADEAAMRAFLAPSPQQLHDPFLMKDMQRAADCVRAAAKEGKNICVYGDYDVDGMCAVSMTVLCLKAMGACVRYYIPSRHDEGYGMNADALRALAAEGVELIITVDNGIRAIAEAELCYELGMSLVVTDHHLCGEELPRAEAVLCHTRADDEYPNHNICGAGTAYKLIEALIGSEKATVYLPLAGLATVADVVPLLDENRVFAALALESINFGKCQLGLKELARRARPGKKLCAQDIAFGIAPRLNAAGRLADASLCVELLCSDDELFCAETAEKLGELNARRQKEETAICAEAFAVLDASDLTDKRAIVLRGDWNSGVIGIAAARIAEQYYRPTMLFSQKDGMLTGSARSIPGVHLYAALLPCADLFSRFGGHAAAAGASMAEENYETFCERFEKSVRAVAPDEVFIPRKSYEMDADLSEMDINLAERIEALEPFGEGNPQPVFHVSRAYLRGLKRMGAEGAHLRGSLCDAEGAKPCVLFGMGGELERLLEMDSCEVLLEPSVNRWKGTESLQLRLKAVRSRVPDDAESYVKGHGEKFIDAFSRNILYNVNCSYAPVKIDRKNEWLISALNADIAGVLVVCCTAAGAAELLREKSALEKMDVRFFNESASACAYHCAVLAPVLDRLHPWRYRRILIYDTPLVRGFAKKLHSLAPDADIYVGEGDGSAEKEALRFLRKDFKPMYLAVRNAGHSFYNRRELSDYLAEATSAPGYLCSLGVSIMLELGFIREDGGLRFVPDAPQSSLDKSETFRALQDIWSGE